MTRTGLRKHLLIVGGVLLLATLLGIHLGVNNDAWWLLGVLVALLHLGGFAALIGWVAKRVRRHRAEASGA